LRLKVDAGVDAVLTQLTFSAEDFCKLVHDCRNNGVSVPIIPGLYIPENLNRLNHLLKITNASMPIKLQQELESLKDDEEKFQERSLSFVANLIGDIQKNSCEHIRGFHFFTLNSLTMLSKLITIVNFSDA
jgi:methylenetetrahydrofolate reductase (NADPH)